MKYRDLTYRLRIEIENNKVLVGEANSEDIDICVVGRDHAFVYINKVQMRFKRLQLGMQKATGDAWLLISGFNDEKSIRICDIEDIFFNIKGIETIHG